MPKDFCAQVSFEMGDNQKAIDLYEAIPTSIPVLTLSNPLEAYLKLGDLDQALLARKLMTVHHGA